MFLTFHNTQDKHPSSQRAQRQKTHTMYQNSADTFDEVQLLKQGRKTSLIPQVDYR